MSKNFYDKVYYANAGAFEDLHPLEKEFYKRIIQPKRGEKVLDVGCGTGSTLSMLAETDADLWGIDISETAVEIAKKRGIGNPEQIICASADPLPFSENKFDYILALGVIEHFPSIPSIVAEIRRCLKENGRAIIAVPNTFYYKFVWDTLRKGSGPRKHQEMEVLYSFKEWKDLIEKAGLTIVKVTRHNKFDRTKLGFWLVNILIPFYFSNHFIFICKK